MWQLLLERKNSPGTLSLSSVYNTFTITCHSLVGQVDLVEHLKFHLLLSSPFWLCSSHRSPHCCHVCEWWNSWRGCGELPLQCSGQAFTGLCFFTGNYIKIPASRNGGHRVFTCINFYAIFPLRICFSQTAPWLILSLYFPGVLIACYLVFATRMSADQAILFVRAKRPNSIQTRGQLLCVREFSQFLVPLRNVFACCEPRAHAVTLSQYLTRQRHLLHGYESRHLKHVPKLVHLVCKLLLDLAENRQVVEAELLDIPDLSAEIEETVSQLAPTELERELELARHDSDASDSSHAHSSALDTQDSHCSLGHECDSFCRRRNVECLQPLTHLRRRLSYSESDLRRTEFLLEQDDTAWTVPAQILVNNKSKQNSGEESSATGEAKPQLELNKEALVRNMCTFWSQGRFSLDGQRDGSYHRRNSAKEVQRSRTFSSGLASIHSPKEPGGPRHSFANETARRKYKTNIYGRRVYLSEDSDSSSSSSKVSFSIGYESQASREVSETIPHIVLQSELSLEARRVLAAKALADINEFLGEDEVKQKVEMWQVFFNSIPCYGLCIFHLSEFLEWQKCHVELWNSTLGQHFLWGVSSLTGWQNAPTHSGL